MTMTTKSNPIDKMTKQQFQSALGQDFEPLCMAEDFDHAFESGRAVDLFDALADHGFETESVRHYSEDYTELESIAREILSYFVAESKSPDSK